MAEIQLRPRGPASLTTALLSLALIGGCESADRLPGMTLDFACVGKPLGVGRFQPEGMRNMPPGSLGCGPQSGAQMGFVPVDANGRQPTYVDIEWVIENEESERLWKEWEQHPDKYGALGMQTHGRYSKALSRYTARVDLRSVVTPDVLAAVKENPSTTQLRLTILFNEGTVDVKASAFQWQS
jgi:hypothetical protein